MFENLKIAELKAIIKEYNLIVKIKGYSKMTKSELVDEIKKHLKIDEKGEIHLLIKENELKYEVKPKGKKEITEAQLMASLASLRGEKNRMEKFASSQIESEKKIGEKRLPEVISEMKKVAAALILMREKNKKDSEKKEKKSSNKKEKKGSEKMEKKHKKGSEKKEKKSSEKKEKKESEKGNVKENLKLIKDVFQELIDKIKAERNPKKNKYRIKSLQNALDYFRSLKVKSITPTELKDIKGIGKGVIDRVKEIIETGTLKEINEEKKEDEIDMSKKQLLKEHKKLIPLLKTGTKKERVKEANLQEKEMAKYELKKPNKIKIN
jgi:hypothetical protein